MNRIVTLGVNIDHVATLRQARGGDEPCVLQAAREVESTDADAITVHLREDRRHIQDVDVYELHKILTKKLNLEMSLNQQIVEIALDVCPQQVTLVPEKRKELTTEGGLDVLKEWRKIEGIIPHFKKKGILVSLFVDPDLKQIKQSALIGADAIELHTGQYAEAFINRKYTRELEALVRASQEAHALGLSINAGHGLTYHNVAHIVTLPFIEELNIGHSIISRSVFVGLHNAVNEMIKSIKAGLR